MVFSTIFYYFIHRIFTLNFVYFAEKVACKLCKLITFSVRFAPFFCKSAVKSSALQKIQSVKPASLQQNKKPRRLSAAENPAYFDKFSSYLQRE